MRRWAPVKRLTREQFLDRDPTLLSSIFHNPKKEKTIFNNSWFHKSFRLFVIISHPQQIW